MALLRLLLLILVLLLLLLVLLLLLLLLLLELMFQLFLLLLYVLWLVFLVLFKSRSLIKLLLLRAMLWKLKRGVMLCCRCRYSRLVEDRLGYRLFFGKNRLFLYQYFENFAEKYDWEA